MRLQIAEELMQIAEVEELMLCAHVWCDAEWSVSREVDSREESDEAPLSNRSSRPVWF